MDYLILFTSIIAFVILGTVLNNKFPQIPVSIFQVALGAIFAIAKFTPNFELDTTTFMTLIIAPLLFTNGFKLSRSKFWLYRTPIFLMAIGLVFVTVAIVGGLIKFLLPAIPLSAAFAVAAILSPTDAIAVKSITKGMKLPKGLMDILEGESLLNDAAGLVSFNIALSAVLTGTFSMSKAAQDFVIIAIGGGLLGLVLGLIILKLKQIFSSLVGAESSAIVVYQLLTPIFVYIIADQTFGVSGIVAVIATSILFNLERDVRQEENINSESTLLVESNETTIGYLLNGFVFVFLGYMLPDIFINMYEYKELTVRLALVYVLLITLAMMIIRYVFVYILYSRFQGHTFTSFQKMSKALTERKLDVGNYSRHEYSLISAVSGIHGTITMATAILIPVTLTTGEAFPLRNTILFIASCVVILSMVIGAIFLPIIVKKSDKEYLELNKIRIKAIEETIKEIKENHKPYIPTNDNDEQADLSRKKQLAYGMVIKKLQEQLIYFSTNKEEKKVIKEVRALHKIIRKEENKKILELKEKYNLEEFAIKILEIRQLRRDKLITYSISKHVFLQLKLARIESRYRHIVGKHFIQGTMEYRKKIRKNGNIKLTEAEKKEEYKKQLSAVSQRLFNNFQPAVLEFNDVALRILEAGKSNYHPLTTVFLESIAHNFNNVLFIRFMSDPNTYKIQYDELKMEAIQLQKYRIMTMKKLKRISKEDGDALLRDLNYSEALLFVGN